MTSPGTLALATRGLRKSYGKRLALDGLDLSVPSGVVYGFLGPNGAGKTTTMRLLTGLLHPDAGSIELLGAPFRRGDRRRLFEVGALVENPSFYPYLSGRRNLEVLAAAGAPVPPRRVDELLELVGLRERARDKVSGYSLGMKQRLGIAGALLSDPEAAPARRAGERPRSRPGIVAMREMLRRLAATGKTIFVSSHLLAEVRVLADVVGIIAAGKLVREGTLESLLSDQGVVRVRVPARTTRRRRARPRADREDRCRRRHGRRRVAGRPCRAESRRSGESRPRRCRASTRPGLESGTDLELLFLQLTGGGAPSSEGTFGAAGVTAGDGAPAPDRPAGPAAGAPMRLFFAGLRKLVGRPASFVSVGLLVGLLGLILIAAATVQEDGAQGRRGARALITFPGAYDLILSFMFGLGGLVAVIYGAAIAGSEWGWGTLKNAVARGESRTRYMLGIFAAIVVMLGVGLLITFVLGVALALLAASIAGIVDHGLTDADTLNRLPALAARGWFAVVEQAVARVRDRDAGPQPARRHRRGDRLLLRRELRRDLLPRRHQVPALRGRPRLARHRRRLRRGRRWRGGAHRRPSSPMSPWCSSGVWLLGALLVSILFTERAEITG